MSRSQIVHCLSYLKQSKVVKLKNEKWNFKVFECHDELTKYQNKNENNDLSTIIPVHRTFLEIDKQTQTKYISEISNNMWNKKLLKNHK